MKQREDVPQSSATPGRGALAAAESAKGPDHTPILVRAFRVPWLFFSHTWVKCGLWLLGALVQMVLLVLAWRLVQVVADVSELWLALARKHLELTL